MHADLRRGTGAPLVSERDGAIPWPGRRDNALRGDDPEAKYFYGQAASDIGVIAATDWEQTR